MSSIRRWLFSVVLAAACAVALPVPAQLAPPAGAAVFESRCKACHAPPIGRAPGREQLAQRPAADIVRALTSGPMVPMAQGLTAGEIQAVAAYLTAVEGSQVATPAPPPSTGPPTSVSAPAGEAPRCASNPPIRSGPGDWASMGLDEAATRFQRRPGLTAAEVPRLKVKWAFSMSGGGQPTAVGDWLFVTNRSGRFYALDARSGCVRWSADGLGSRTTPMVVKSAVAPSGWATFIGTSDRTVRAFDAQTGQPLWKSVALEAHPFSVLTGSPAVAGDRLIVPMSSIEEAAAMSKAYACCTFRGSVAALDLATGARLWQTSMVDEPPRVIREKAGGLKVQGPAGAAVWSAPMIDRERGLAYVATGDSYTDVEMAGADAIVALDLATGAIRWRRQVTQHDNFVMGCGPNSQSGNCPTPVGPDYDFGATPVMMTLPAGRQVLVAGQKSGLVYGFDPDSGTLLWKTAVGAGSALGGVEWGIGADDAHVFVPISDLVRLFDEGRPGAVPGRPGLYALDPATGTIAWATPAPKAACVYASDKGRPSRCARAQSAAPAVIPGIVFEGALDGWFRAYDARTGKIVWEDSTTSRTYDTLNGVRGQPGGGVDGMGPTVAGGMVYVMSGHNGAAKVGSNGVNVLLAYSVDGR